MTPLTITSQTRRRFIMGLQGLYPGRRWRGKEGVAAALHALGGLQIDPINVVARSHDITLWGRVADYDPADLDTLLYSERRFFDYGAWLAIRPMETLPYWRLIMERRRTSQSQRSSMAEYPGVAESVLEYIRTHGAVTNRTLDLDLGAAAQHSFRSGKVSGRALYHLWLTGELMTTRRQGNFERVYDLRERVAPAEYNYAASVDEAEGFFARQVLREVGMATLQKWRPAFVGTIERPVTPAEAQARLDTLLAEGAVVTVQVAGETKPYYVRGEDYPLLETLHSGAIPDAWLPTFTRTDEEMVFLSPLDMVSARGRAKVLFDFEYIWEVYKPIEKRRFGYYTMPILYGDRLVGRIDPKFNRATKTLELLGVWWEEGVNGATMAASEAFLRGVERFRKFVML